MATPRRCRFPAANSRSSYDDLRSIKALPDEVMVIGGADTGCQIASIFDDFGVAVRILEFGPTLVAFADPTSPQRCARRSRPGACRSAPVPG